MKKIRTILNSFFKKVRALLYKIRPSNPAKVFFVKNRKIFTLVVVIFLVLLGGYFAKGLFVVAVVNGQPISRLEVVKQLEKNGGASVEESLIDKALVKQEIARKKITVNKSDIQAYISQVEQSLKGQSQDINAALAAQGMTMADYEKQVEFQMQIQKLLADKVSVTDADVQKYINDNKAQLPTGQDLENAKPLIKSQLEQERLTTEIQALVASLKGTSKIIYFVKY